MLGWLGRIEEGAPNGPKVGHGQVLPRRARANDNQGRQKVSFCGRRVRASHGRSKRDSVLEIHPR